MTVTGPNFPDLKTLLPGVTRAADPLIFSPPKTRRTRHYKAELAASGELVRNLSEAVAEARAAGALARQDARRAWLVARVCAALFAVAAVVLVAAVAR